MVYDRKKGLHTLFNMLDIWIVWTSPIGQCTAESLHFSNEFNCAVSAKTSLVYYAIAR